MIRLSVRRSFAVVAFVTLACTVSRGTCSASGQAPSVQREPGKSDNFWIDDFGAAGDAVSDDHAAFVQANSACLAAGGGDIRLTPGKRYLNNSSFVLGKTGGGGGGHCNLIGVSTAGVGAPSQNGNATDYDAVVRCGFLDGRDAAHACVRPYGDETVRGITFQTTAYSKATPTTFRGMISWLRSYSGYALAMGGGGDLIERNIFEGFCSAVYGNTVGNFIIRDNVLDVAYVSSCHAIDLHGVPDYALVSNNTARDITFWNTGTYPHTFPILSATKQGKYLQIMTSTSQPYEKGDTINIAALKWSDGSYKNFRAKVRSVSGASKILTDSLFPGNGAYIGGGLLVWHDNYEGTAYYYDGTEGGADGLRFDHNTSNSYDIHYHLIGGNQVAVYDPQTVDNIASFDPFSIGIWFDGASGSIVQGGRINGSATAILQSGVEISSNLVANIELNGNSAAPVINVQSGALLLVGCYGLSGQAGYGVGYGSYVYIGHSTTWVSFDACDLTHVGFVYQQASDSRKVYVDRTPPPSSTNVAAASLAPPRISDVITSGLSNSIFAPKDCGTTIEYAGTSLITYIIPASLPIGCRITLIQKGLGSIRLKGGSGMTPAPNSALTTPSQSSAVTFLVDRPGMAIAAPGL